MATISVAEFKTRLETLCTKGGGRGLPRSGHDQQILFKSIVLTLDSQRAYTETDLNQALGQWLVQVGQTIEIDHVSLRRHLVDEGYISRDSAGGLYTVSTAASDQFDPGIDALDPATVIVEAQLERERKKQEYLNKQNR
ncbi:MAG: DUF2087 domain-containing protein [Anaerolineae bacterium]|nr:DUF2087 domain-containing protein [Anaerolineae bacterium]